MTNNTQKILIVDNDDAQRNAVAEQIEIIEGHVAIQASTGEQTLRLVKDQHPELMLLDVDLPDIDGRDLCRLLRRQGMKTPIITLGRDNGDAEVILSLNNGASDYVTKPFHVGVLLARMRAHRRQFEQSTPPPSRSGPMPFMPAPDS
ncbi:MAG: response regulator transcription factor [Geminicoccaceae bacterium]